MKKRVIITISATITLIITSLVVGFTARYVIMRERNQSINLSRDIIKTYSEALEGFQEANIILESAFVDTYYRDRYRRLMKAKDRITTHRNNINDFLNSIKNEDEYLDNLTEGILALRAVTAASVCMTSVMFMSDIIAYYTGVGDQYTAFGYLNEQLEYTIDNLKYYVNDLNDITAKSTNKKRQSIYAKLKDRIGDAKEIFEELKEDMEERYKAAKKLKETLGEGEDTSAGSKEIAR